jgi:Na+/melibiose symporter-like transporter
LWALVTKAAAAITLLIGLQILGWVGYVPNVEQTPQVVLTMRLLYSLFPGLWYLAALIIFQGYAITQAVHHEIQSSIAERDNRLGDDRRQTMAL